MRGCRGFDSRSGENWMVTENFDKKGMFALVYVNFFFFFPSAREFPN